MAVSGLTTFAYTSGHISIDRYIYIYMYVYMHMHTHTYVFVHVASLHLLLSMCILVSVHNGIPHVSVCLSMYVCR